LEDTESAFLVEAPQNDLELGATDAPALVSEDGDINVTSSSEHSSSLVRRLSAPEGSKLSSRRESVAYDSADTPPNGTVQKRPWPRSKPADKTYGTLVYAALERHKPTATKRGSTTVIFTIGSSGALNNVRVAKSSGNSRVDHIALQTVRDAAPFAPPPNGASSYMIRIDFR
jgi:TonB family protein